MRFQWQMSESYRHAHYMVATWFLLGYFIYLCGSYLAEDAFVARDWVRKKGMNDEEIKSVLVQHGYTPQSAQKSIENFHIIKNRDKKNNKNLILLYSIFAIIIIILMIPVLIFLFKSEEPEIDFDIFVDSCTLCNDAGDLCGITALRVVDNCDLHQYSPRTMPSETFLLFFLSYPLFCVPWVIFCTIHHLPSIFIRWK